MNDNLTYDSFSNRDSKPNLCLVGVCKAFDGRQILNKVSVEFHSGVFAITGPNGCGKTTLLSIMGAALLPDSGRVLISSIDLEAKPQLAKTHLAFLPDEPYVYPFLSGTNFLNLICTVRKLTSAYAYRDLVEGFNLQDHLNSRFGNMSLGTKRKFMLVATFLGEWPVVVLDEPSDALDARSREFLVNLINRRASTSTTILADHNHQLLNKTAATEIKLESGQLRIPEEVRGVGFKEYRKRL